MLVSTAPTLVCQLRGNSHTCNPQVRRREHLHRMADIERKAADMHTANAAVFGRAAREAYDQGKPAGL